MKSHIRRVGAATLATLTLIGALATTALADSAQILQDVESATQRVGQEQPIGGLPVTRHGGLVTTQTATGIDLAVPAGKITQTERGTIVTGNGQSNIVFQNAEDGRYRASIHISSPRDPERYEFNITGATHLLKQFDGSVQAFNAAGQQIAVIKTPWAKDKTGKDVKTYYETNGTTLSQIVSHRNENLAYGITADPAIIPIALFGARVVATCAARNAARNAAIASARTAAALRACRASGVPPLS